MYGDAVTIVQLTYVRAAADLGSFSKAAASLGVTQPALSNGVAALERTIGAELFLRSRSGATLTPLGERILPHFLRILGAVESVAAEVRSANMETPTLRVGVSPLIHPGVIARALEGASRNGLGPLVLREDDMVPLRDALVGRQLDLILIPAVPGLGRFAHRTLEAEPLHYMPSSRAGAFEQQAVELTSLSATQLVMVGDGCGLTTFTEALFAGSQQQPQRYPGEADSYTTLQDWAALGLGGALLPQSKYRLGAATVPVLRDGTPVLISYEAVWDPDSAHSTLIGALLDAMASNPNSAPAATND